MLKLFRSSSLALALCAVLFTQGCWFFGNGSATDQFARANYELSGLTGEALRVIHETLKARITKPDTAIAAANAIGKFNTAHKALLRRIALRLQTEESGKEVIVFGASDQTAVEGFLNEMAQVARDVIADPVILDLDSATRIEVQAALSALTPFISKMLGLVRKLPKLKQDAPPLRLQLPAATALNFKLLLPRLDELDKMAAEIR